jgi:hypothetical protein
VKPFFLTVWLVLLPFSSIAGDGGDRKIKIILESCPYLSTYQGQTFETSFSNIQIQTKDLKYDELTVVDGANILKKYEIPLDFVNFKFDTSNKGDSIIVINCISNSKCVKITDPNNKLLDTRRDFAIVGACDRSQQTELVGALKSNQLSK